jgi:alpha-dioxygenase
LKTRPPDGFGHDVNNPTTANHLAPIGRNMPAIPKHLRDPHGSPDVQMVAQRLLAREEFKPAADQLNIMAAAWIQAMVHDWINHLDSDRDVTLDKGAGLCPMKKFTFKATLEREDGHFER